PAPQPEISDSSKKPRFEVAGNSYIWLIAFGALAVAMILAL
ncbi:MAG: hypothetical protein ACI96M_004054, partial [Candidatus Azotimanducaceae bacterium]